MHVDQKGIPPGLVAVGANLHDSRFVGFTIEHNSDIAVQFQLCSGRFHLCLDKGYDYDRVEEEVFVYGLESHIRARRWVVERTIAWLKGFRGIRTRYCRYLSSFEASVKLACAIIIFRKIKLETSEQ